MKRKRISKVTIRQAEDALHLLFPSVRFVVAPNGENVLWVKDAEGYGFRVTFSSGNAGVSATIGKFTGMPPVSVTGNKSRDMEAIPMIDAFEVSAVVYRDVEYAQQFKRWYAADSIAREQQVGCKHPDELGMKPEARP